ncbi:helix-turn-helix domain-containing protein [Streptomyces coffeae]|uniref:DUF2690 domain-containing protein n=1 Tax=Streptomyces coffeae TaxID=621382 RepID=A0ABS1N678_9ACTN|nr:XRE family transcriptional regulator [Streptomyces coffeae]MBL1095460.1 DUF2690 domain-containing protein [Streptomyces coffeae]
MPRWRELPEELDPQVREFTGQLRRIVERSGMSVVAVADRTGYSKSSWERYLNGRLLPPQRAVEALAEATGAGAHHLITLWELAERAWSRSENRHDVTMEAISVAQARAAIEEFAPEQGKRNGHPSEKAVKGAEAAEADRAAAPPGPERPRMPTAAATAPPTAPYPGAAPSAPGVPAAPDSSEEGRGGRRRMALFAGAAVGSLLLVAGAVFLVGTGDGDDGKPVAAPKTAPATTAPSLPRGVKCAGKGCTGKDPEAMGCGGAKAITSANLTVGTAYVEVRYSEICGAAWARITRAAPGDQIRVSAPGGGGGASVSRSGEVNTGGEAYTRMVSVKTIAQATACATLTSGARGCTDRTANG